jgi:hypothetical protein
VVCARLVALFHSPAHTLTFQHTLEELTAFELEYRAWSEDFVRRAKQALDESQKTSIEYETVPLQVSIDLARSRHETRTRINAKFQSFKADFDRGTEDHANTPALDTLRTELLEMEIVLIQELRTVKMSGYWVNEYKWGFPVYEVGSLSRWVVALAGLPSCTRFLCV